MATTSTHADITILDYMVLRWHIYDVHPVSALVFALDRGPNTSKASLAFAVPVKGNRDDLPGSVGSVPGTGCTVHLSRRVCLPKLRHQPAWIDRDTRAAAETDIAQRTSQLVRRSVSISHRRRALKLTDGTLITL